MDGTSSTQRHLCLTHFFVLKLYQCKLCTVFDCVDDNKLGKILKETTWPASWEICTQVKKQQLELNMEQQTGSK